MPKTIADLGSSSEQPVVIGKSLLNDGHRPVEERVRELEEKRRKENELLESAGYDYNGDEAWASVMSHLGRR